MLLAAAVDAAIHHLPNTPQSGVNLFFAVAGFLVLHQDLGNGQAGALADGQQFAGSAERIRLLDFAGAIVLLLARFRIADHETTTHGVVDLLVQNDPAGVIGRETHAVGVLGQGLMEMKRQMLFFLERNPVVTGQVEFTAGADLGDQRFDPVRIHLVWRFPQ